MARFVAKSSRKPSIKPGISSSWRVSPDYPKMQNVRDDLLEECKKAKNLQFGMQEFDCKDILVE